MLLVTRDYTNQATVNLFWNIYVILSFRMLSFIILNQIKGLLVCDSGIGNPNEVFYDANHEHHITSFTDSFSKKSTDKMMEILFI